MISEMHSNKSKLFKHKIPTFGFGRNDRNTNGNPYDEYSYDDDDDDDDDDLDYDTFIAQIDAVIHNLSDCLLHKVPIDSSSSSNTVSANTDANVIANANVNGSARPSKKRRCNRVSFHDDEDDDSNGIHEEEKDLNCRPLPVLVPVGLEHQYSELHALLRRGLLGPSFDLNDNDIDGCDLYNNDYDNDDIMTRKRKRRSRGSDIGLGLSSIGGEKRNVSALLLGPRGQGKSLVLERCLTSLKQEVEERNRIHNRNQRRLKMTKNNKDKTVKTQSATAVAATAFRVIRLNGILLRGQDVDNTVREIVSQLSQIASKESYERNRSNSQNDIYNGNEIHNHNNNNEMHVKLFNILEKESHSLRTRRTTFNNSLAILDEVLRTACIDSIPMLIVLDEVDSFLSLSTSSSNSSSGEALSSSSSSFSSSSKRHLLLYHLLDRVAGSGSLISLVMSTSRLSTIGLFEKRVKSRADGTTKSIYFGRPSNYEILVNMMLSKFWSSGDISNNSGKGSDNGIRNGGKTRSSGNERGLLNQLKEQIREILLPSSSLLQQIGNTNKNSNKNMSSDEQQRQRDELVLVRDLFQRNFSCGQDIRWFCRILSACLSLYAGDVMKILQLQNEKDGVYCNDQRPQGYNLNKKQGLPKISANHFIDALVSMGGTNINSKVINIPDDGNDDNSNSIYKTIQTSGNPRIDILMDLTGPQLTILISAKRITARDSQEEHCTKVLTFERILKEYESYFIAQSKSTGPDNYSEHILYKSFCDLLGGLIMPVKDHAGPAPLQYQYYHNCASREKKAVLSRVPLYLNADIDGELGEALKNNLLDCTTALRDWGILGSRI